MVTQEFKLLLCFDPFGSDTVTHAVGLSLTLMRQFKISNDPNVEENLENVVGLYLNPPENTVVFSVDEKSSIQALDRTQPRRLPMKLGRAGTITHDYKRHGTNLAPRCFMWVDRISVLRQ